MYIGLNEDQQALRRELRGYYAGLLTPTVREELHREAGCGPVHRQVISMLKSGLSRIACLNVTATTSTAKFRFSFRQQQSVVIWKFLP